MVEKTMTQTQTRVEIDVALRKANLTSEEEKVVRMRHGIRMAPDGELTAHTLVSVEASAQIAAIEQKAIAHSRRQQAVIARLRQIDG